MPVHIVVPGDTLSEIALRHGLTVQEIQDANPEIQDPNFIVVGQRIGIPLPDEWSIASEGDFRVKYVVRSTDTIESIAFIQRVTVVELLAANPGLDDREALMAGLVLTIPAPSILISAPPEIQFE
jgi:morphogenetic protein associated with SpoVID